MTTPTTITIAPELNRALTRANITFTTFSILAALGDGRKTIIRVAEETGMTYNAVRQQIRRTHHFNLHHDHPLYTITATPEARQLLKTINQKFR